ncbi:MAG: hypothetical protein FWG89_09210 [Treponema sp.]|nr:hypothetical protein [Treponema sp.]
MNKVLLYMLFLMFLTTSTLKAQSQVPDVVMNVINNAPEDVFRTIPAIPPFQLPQNSSIIIVCG